MSVFFSGQTTSMPSEVVRDTLVFWIFSNLRRDENKKTKETSAFFFFRLGGLFFFFFSFFFFGGFFSTYREPTRSGAFLGKSMDNVRTDKKKLPSEQERLLEEVLGRFF